MRDAYCDTQGLDSSFCWQEVLSLVANELLDKRTAEGKGQVSLNNACVLPQSKNLQVMELSASLQWRKVVFLKLTKTWLNKAQ